MQIRRSVRAAVGTFLLVASASCSEQSSDFQVAVYPAAGVDWSRLTMQVTGPGLNATLRRSHFRQDPAGTNQFSGPKVFFDGSGTARAVVRLTDADGTPAVAIGVTFDVEPEWSYGLSAHIGGPRPAGLFCGRIVGAAPLPRLTGESLFVAQGGRPKDAVC